MMAISHASRQTHQHDIYMAHSALTTNSHDKPKLTKKIYTSLCKLL